MSLDEKDAKSLKNSLDLEDFKIVDEFISMISSDDDIDDISNKFEKVFTSPKRRKVNPEELNKVNPEPTFESDISSDVRSKSDDVEISDIGGLNLNSDSGNDVKFKENFDNKDFSNSSDFNFSDPDSESSDLPIEKNNEPTMFSKTQYVKRSIPSDEFFVDPNDLKFKSNRPFNYRKFFNEKDESFNEDLKTKNISPNKPSDILKNYYGDSPFSEVYLHLNHTRIVPKSPTEQRSIFATPVKSQNNIKRQSFTPNEHRKSLEQFNLELDQHVDVKFINNQARRKRLNSPDKYRRKTLSAKIIKRNLINQNSDTIDANSNDNYNSQTLNSPSNAFSRTQEINHKYSPEVEKLSPTKKNSKAKSDFDEVDYENDNEDQIIQNIKFDSDGNKNMEEEEVDM